MNMTDIPARRRRPSRAEDREKLLDAAEALFAQRGFHAVSVREITEQAGTRLAEINDSFGGKESLFREVVCRRASVINQDREALLARLPEQGDRPLRLHGLIEAFAAPLLARIGESEGWGHYLRLVAQLNVVRGMELLWVRDQFNPIAIRFIEGLKAIYPDAGDRAVVNAYQFMVSCSMSIFSHNFRMDVLTDGRLASSDFSENYQDLVCFLQAGVGGLLEEGRKGRHAV